MFDQKSLAFAYIRFSSKKQELGDSVGRQLHDAQQWCARNNCILSDKTFEDLGVSAFKEGGKRPALEDLINCVIEGSIPKGSYILFENSDRLTRRGYSHAKYLIEKLVNEGVYAVVKGDIYRQGDSEQLIKILPLLFDADRARIESERKSEIIANAKKKIRENRELKGRMPFWISKSADGRKAILNQHADMARMIIEYRLCGKSNQKIAQLLNYKGLLTANGAPWGSTSIANVYTNPSIYGAKRMMSIKNGRPVTVEVVDNFYPQLVTKDIFELLNLKSTVTKEKVQPSKWSNLLKCGLCGGALSSSKNRGIAYHVCYASYEGRCNGTGYIKSVDSVLSNYLSNLKVVKINDESVNGSLISEIEELKAQIEKLNNVMSFADGDIASLLDVRINETREKILSKQSAVSISKRSVSFDYILGLDSPLAINKELKRFIKIIEVVKSDKRIDNYTITFKDGKKTSFVVHHAHFVKDGFNILHDKT